MMNDEVVFTLHSSLITHHSLPLGLAGLGAVAGLLGSLLGLGGGVLTTPLLILLFGVPIEQAIATSLVAIIGTSSAATGVYVERGRTNVRLGTTLELATTIGAICGAVVGVVLSRRWLTTIFSAFLFLAGTSMLRGAYGGEAQTEAPEGEAYQVRRLPLGMFASCLAGAVSGLLGVGGGPVLVPAMYLLMGLPLKVATATGNFTFGVTAAASAYIYYTNGNILAYPTAPVVLGVFLGSIAGTHLSRRVPTRWILWLFVGVMYYLSVSMGWKALEMGVSR